MQMTKSTLRKLEYPECAKEALKQIENLIVGRNDQAIDLISEFVFAEKGKETDSRTAYQQTTLSLSQEFQLIVVLCEYFSKPGKDATRNAMFLSLFGGSITTSRSSILVKLISTSVSGLIAPILSSAGTWMQQLGCTSVPSLELAQSLIKDFITFAKKPSEQLKSLPMIAPRFAANFMTAVSDLYLNESRNNCQPPPSLILEVFTDWITENPVICLASQQQLALPTGAIAMPVSTPLSNLIRWCVLAPIYDSKESYSKLHLGLLQSLLQSSPASPNLPATALNAQHLGLIINTLQSQARKIEPFDQTDKNSGIELSLERFAQAIQVGLSSRAIFGNISQLICRLETLPHNILMDIVIKVNKN